MFRLLKFQITRSKNQIKISNPKIQEPKRNPKSQKARTKKLKKQISNNKNQTKSKSQCMLCSFGIWYLDFFLVLEFWFLEFFFFGSWGFSFFGS
jgi:hypothetical protein